MPARTNPFGSTGKAGITTQAGDPVRVTRQEDFVMDIRVVLRSFPPKRIVASAMLVAALSATAVSAATPSAGRPADDPVVARVNDIEIHESDVRAADKEMGRNLPMRETRREDVINLLIEAAIVSGAAGQTQLDEAEIRARTAFVRNRVIMEQVIEAAGRKAVSEQSVRKAYDEMAAKVLVKPEYHLYELYFPVPNRNDEAAMKAAEQKARTAYDRITKGDAFEAVVRDMSTVPSAKANGGNRGYVTLDMIGTEFADVVPTLEKGKTSRPIKTQVGWHLIKYEEKRMRTPPDLQSVREGLELDLASQARSDFVSKLRSQAKIERLDNASAGSSGATAGK